MSLKKRCLSFGRLAIGVLSFAFTLPAYAIAIDFESLTDSTVLTTQIAGLTFTNATVLTAGVSLNEFEFPPYSGDNVIFDDGGMMHIVFDASQSSVGGYFTYAAPLMFTAFDSFNNSLGTTTSLYSSNMALSGDLGSFSNEFLSLSFADIKSITIAGDLFGASFTLDDLTFTAQQVPEPSTLALMLGSLVILGVSVRRQKKIGRAQVYT